MAAPISPEARAEILAYYAVTGNVREAGRRANVSGSTAQRVVTRAIQDKDPELTHTGAELRAAVLDAVERAVSRAVGVAVDRLEDPKWAQRFKADPGAQYVRAVVDAHKSLGQAERLAAELRGEVSSGGVQIQIVGPEGAAVVEPDEGDEADRGDG
jgi:hypothetical protein